MASTDSADKNFAAVIAPEDIGTVNSSISVLSARSAAMRRIVSTGVTTSIIYKRPFQTGFKSVLCPMMLCEEKRSPPQSRTPDMKI